MSVTLPGKVLENKLQHDIGQNNFQENYKTSKVHYSNMLKRVIITLQQVGLLLDFEQEQ